MDAAYLASTDEALDYFHVTEASGLSSRQVEEFTQRYGLNCMIIKCLQLVSSNAEVSS